MKKGIIAMLLCAAITVGTPAYAKMTPGKVYDIDEGQRMFGDAGSACVQCTIQGWAGTASADEDGNDVFVLHTDDTDENLVIRVEYFDGGMPVARSLPVSFSRYLEVEESEVQEIEEKDLSGDGRHVLKTMTYTSPDGTYYEDGAINGSTFVLHFVYSGDKGSGYDDFKKIISDAKYVPQGGSAQVKTDAKSGIESFINSHIKKTYSDTDIDKITINDDLGTGSGYIALVYLTWNVKNSADTSKKMLKMYSDDLAATVAGKYADVHEISVFWKVPYLTDQTSKWQYSCKEGNAFLTDNVVNF